MFTGCRQRQTICGVPVKGTPWELAAAIHDRGDYSFAPTTVYQFGDKAYIEGYIFPDEIPATIACDLVDGQVVAAFFGVNNDYEE